MRIIGFRQTGMIVVQDHAGKDYFLTKDYLRDSRFEGNSDIQEYFADYQRIARKALRKFLKTTLHSRKRIAYSRAKVARVRTWDDSECGSMIRGLSWQRVNGELTVGCKTFQGADAKKIREWALEGLL